MTSALTIEDLQKTARSREGECLSVAYHGALSRYRWRCAYGHEWEAPAGRVRHGAWCPACAKNCAFTIEDFRAIARENGGEFLSSEYRNFRTKYRWRCVQGHEWDATGDTIRRGCWCPVCAKCKLTLEDFQAIAREKGGEFLSSIYRNRRTKYRWRCAQGHEWETAAGNVREGNWCPVCAKRRNRGRSPLTLECLQTTARARGGECLSVLYLGSMSKYRWRCAQGHEWEAIASSVRQGSWCPVCAERTRFKRQGMPEDD